MTAPAPTARFARLRALARAATPFVQRALAFEQATRTAVFEAPAGAPVSAATAAIAIDDGLRLLKRLARACVVIHELGATHGAIGPATVVLADATIPTLMVAGVEAAAAPSPAADLAAVVAVVARAVTGADAEEPARALALAAIGRGADLDAWVARPRGDAGALYAWADALEVARIVARRAAG